MDLLDIIRSNPDIVVGHKAVCDSLNARKEAKRFADEPLKALIHVIDDPDSEFTKGDVGRYLQAYSWYSLCLRRILTHMSLARRADAELRYHPRNEKYSDRQKQLAEKHNELGPYTELDYQNLITYSYILLDRVIALSRRFLNGSNLPSFTSFNKHKKFLIKNPNSLDSNYSEYIKYITQNTEWFEIPLKVLRDKILMHSSGRHMSFLGWGESNCDLEMVTIIPATKNQTKLLEKGKAIEFSPRRLARDIESFLTWFAKYGTEKSSQHPTRRSSGRSKPRR